MRPVALVITFIIGELIHQGRILIMLHFLHYDPISVTDGTYYLRIRVIDQAGNSSGWVTLFTLRYDGTVPTGSLSIKEGEPTTYQTYVDSIRLEQTTPVE